MLLVALALAQTPPPASEPEDPPFEPTPEAEDTFKEPVLTEFIQAPYPLEAEQAGIEGTVRLLIEIDEAGAVTRVEVMAPAGHGFDEAAVAAAQQFKFTPAEDSTGPIPVALEFDYTFKLAPPVEVPKVINLEGHLQEMATRMPIGGAVVQVLPREGESILFATTTDTTGYFSFTDVPSGLYRLRAFDTEHKQEDTEIVVAPNEVVDVSLWLKRDSYREAGVIGLYERERTPEVTRRTITIDEVRRIPGTFGDPVRVIQNLPGVARPPFGSGLLVIRGANPEDSNVFVDGVEVPLVYHLGGYRSIINASLIESVDYLPGTYSTTYGRSTGGVIDVRSKSDYPEQVKLTWRSDFLDTGVFATGQIKDKVGFSVGVRRSYLDVLLKLALRNTGFYAAPRWFDYQVKAEALDVGQDQLSALLFGFQDDLIIRLQADEESQVGVHYSTHRLVFHYVHPLTDTLKLDLQPSLGIDGTRFGAGSIFGIELDKILLDLRTNLIWDPSPAWTVRGGLDSEVSWTGYEIFVQGSTVGGDEPLDEGETIAEDDGLFQAFPDPYAEVTFRPLKARDQLSITGGLRLSTLIQSDTSGGVAFDPRLGIRFVPTEGTALKAGTGLYHQPPQGFDLAGEAHFEQSWSSEVGVEQQIIPALRADITGFYRSMSDLNVSVADDYAGGIGRAYGMELMVRHIPIHRFFGWISYTLSKAERNDTPDDPEGWYPFDYDQTHILTAVAGYRLPLDLDVSTRFQYVTGNPYTPYETGIFLMDEGGYLGIPSGDTNSERLADYYAWDLRVEKLFTYKHWQMSVFADLLNVVRGENPEFTIYSYDYTDSAYVRGLPFFPSLGFQVEVNL